MNANYDFKIYLVSPLDYATKIYQLSNGLLHKFLFAFAMESSGKLKVVNVDKVNEFINKTNCEYVIDSGGFFIKQLGIQIDVQLYKAWLNKLVKKPNFILTLDSFDLDWTIENTKYLLNETDFDVYFVCDILYFLSEKKRDELFNKLSKLQGLAGLAFGYPVSKRGMNFKVKFNKTLDTSLFYFKSLADELGITNLHLLGHTVLKILQNVPFTSLDWLAHSSFSSQSYMPGYIKRNNLFKLYNFEKYTSPSNHRKAKYIQFGLAVQYFEHFVKQYWLNRYGIENNQNQ